MAITAAGNEQPAVLREQGPRDCQGATINSGSHFFLNWLYYRHSQSLPEFAGTLE